MRCQRLLLRLLTHMSVYLRHPSRTKSWTRSRIALLACLIITFTALTWNMFVNAAAPFIQDQVILVDIEPEKQGELEALAQKSNIKALPLNYMSSWDITISVSLLC